MLHDTWQSLTNQRASFLTRAVPTSYTYSEISLLYCSLVSRCFVSEYSLPFSGHWIDHPRNLRKMLGKELFFFEHRGTLNDLNANKFFTKDHSIVIVGKVGRYIRPLTFYIALFNSMCHSRPLFVYFRSFWSIFTH